MNGDDLFEISKLDLEKNRLFDVCTLAVKFLYNKVKLFKESIKENVYSLSKWTK